MSPAAAESAAPKCAIVPQLMQMHGAMPLVSSRRSILASLGCAVAAWPAVVRAQGARAARIGFVSWFSAAEAADVEHVRGALRDLGHVDGQTIIIEAHFTDGNREATRSVLQSLVQRNVDVIIVRATAAAHIAKEVAATKPVVMLVADPLATGLVESLSRPGGNLTGLSLLGPDLAGKRLAFLHAIRPGLTTVAFLGSTADPNAPNFARQTKEAGSALGIAVIERLVPGPAALVPSLFEEIARAGAQAVVVQPIFTGHQDRIVALARTVGLPVISNYRVFAQAGALFSYGPDDVALTKRAAYYVDRILKGASPATLPIEQPSQFQLVINTQTARALGLSVPDSLAAIADELVE